MKTGVKIERPTAYFNDYVKGWKEKGGKVIGYSCCAVPVEIVEAAGMLPYRITAMGRADTELGDTEMSLFNCAYTRALLQCGLEGSYDFLDGLIGWNACDHLRSMLELWQYERPTGFYHFLNIPYLATPEAFPYFEENCEGLRNHIAEHFSIEISDEALEGAMDTRDKVRAKWRELCSLREREEPTVSGTETLSLLMIGSFMRSEDFLQLLSEVVDERKDAPGKRPKYRVMVCGPATDELTWFEEIESMGAAIVADALCWGSRALYKEIVEEEGTPIHRLSADYLANLLCPRMGDQYPMRKEFMFNEVKRAKVDGVITLFNKFCVLFGTDGVVLAKHLGESTGIPSLNLEKGYSAAADLGRIKTRIQAFLERIGGGV